MIRIQNCSIHVVIQAAAIIGVIGRQPLECADLSGNITVNTTRPLSSAVVRAQANGQTTVTMTDANGNFTLQDLGGDQVLLSVLQDARMLYKATVRTTTAKIKLDVWNLDLPADFDPVSGSAAGEDVLILNFAGRILRLHDGKLTEITRATPPVTAISAGTIINRAGFFVMRGLPEIALIWQYSMAGTLERAFNVSTSRGCCVSFGVSPGSKIAYLLAGRQVFELNLATGHTRPFWDPVGYEGRGLAALAIDPSRATVYVGEANGAIHVRDASGHGVVIRENIGSIVAMAVDSTRECLYIAEDHKIWRLNTHTNELAVFVSGQPMRALMSLSVDSRGTLWAVDRLARSVFSFSPDGYLASVISKGAMK